MARTVEEIMNRELVATRRDERPERARDIILGLGITALPVLDDERRPVGMLSLRDLFTPGQAPGHTSSPLTVLTTATVEEAARMLAHTDYHQLVVIDTHGRAVGMVSCIDLLRALVGTPARHPSSFPHYDSRLRVTWTDDAELVPQEIATVPDEAGVLLVVHGGPGLPETPARVEQSPSMRTRLSEIVSVPQVHAPRLASLLAGGGLRFRTASVPDDGRRVEIVRDLRAQIGA
jgi:CBS domain-containing protein